MIEKAEDMFSALDDSGDGEVSQVSLNINSSIGAQLAPVCSWNHHLI